MRKSFLLAGVLGAHLACAPTVRAQPSLTIYNQNFAVVRESVPLDLKVGMNTVSYTDITTQLEPDSLVLRDPAGVHKFTILEQNYRADPVSQALLLSLYEGKTIDFQVRRGETTEIVRGRVIRSGYVPPPANTYYRSGAYYSRSGQYYGAAGSEQPIIEVDGRLQFSLPGTPLFPVLADDTILKPTLYWNLDSARAGRFNAELAYVTGGLSWAADYNLIAPEEGDTMDILGWVTFNNHSGKSFRDAQVKLMAGDVNKMAPGQPGVPGPQGPTGPRGEPAVTQKSFDEYHLYSLARRVALRDQETKQVEFVRAEKVKAARIYVYDGLNTHWNGWHRWRWSGNVNNSPSYGAESPNRKVWVMREFENSAQNGLGIPLPAGQLRFYRRDTDGQLEFTGENVIDHTPKDETVRVYTGNSFDLVGERIRTDYKSNRPTEFFETFEITLRNHKNTPVEVRVVEHLYRWNNWKLIEKSHDFKKLEAQTIEFRVQLAPDEEEKVTYTVHYTW